MDIVKQHIQPYPASQLRFFSTYLTSVTVLQQSCLIFGRKFFLSCFIETHEFLLLYLGSIDYFIKGMKMLGEVGLTKTGLNEVS
jgi:hypothetical protein